MSTADFVRHRDASLRAGHRTGALAEVLGESNLSTVAANQLADKLLGKTIYANVLMLGFAWQHGLVPVSQDALLRAIELNGVDIERNKEAFGWGRLAAADIDFVFEQTRGPVLARPAQENLQQMISRRADFLVDYQDRALSERYLALVEKCRDAEQALTGSGDLPLTMAVARAWFKTLAYKDEYEVARLHTQTGFLENLRKEYGTGAKLRFHLAPPMLPSKPDARGRPRKREFGQWMIPLFRILARFRRLRGTAFDLLGRSTERRMERALIVEFEQNVTHIVDALSVDNLEPAIEIVNLYLDIRGYGPVKEAAAEEVREKIDRHLADYLNVTRTAA